MLRISLNSGNEVYGLRPHNTPKVFQGLGRLKNTDIRVLLMFPKGTSRKIRAGAYASVEISEGLFASLQTAARKAVEKEGTERFFLKEKDFHFITDDEKWGKWELVKGTANFKKEHLQLVTSKTEAGSFMAGPQGHVLLKDPDGNYVVMEDDQEALDIGCSQAIIWAVQERRTKLAIESAAKAAAEKSEAASRKTQQEEERRQREEERKIKWDTEVRPKLEAWMMNGSLSDDEFELDSFNRRSSQELSVVKNDGFELSHYFGGYAEDDPRYKVCPFSFEKAEEMYICF